VDPESGAGTDRPRLDRFAGVAPAVVSPPSAGPASASPVADSPDEETMLRPAGAVPSVSSGPSPLPPAGSRPEPPPAAKPPAWPFVTLAAVAVILLGIGATFGVRYFFVAEPDPIA